MLIMWEITMGREGMLPPWQVGDRCKRHGQLLEIVDIRQEGVKVTLVGRPIGSPLR